MHALVAPVLEIVMKSEVLIDEKSICKMIYMGHTHTVGKCPYNYYTDDIV